MDTTRSTTFPDNAEAELAIIINELDRKSNSYSGNAAFPISDAMLACITSAADTAFDQHNRTNGSTVSLIHGSMVGQKLYSVSIYPSRSITLWEPPTRENFFEYAKANLDPLLRPSHALGSWFNGWDLVHCLDVVVLVSDLNAAFELGRLHNQIAIFDLEARREISIPRTARDPITSTIGGGND